MDYKKYLYDKAEKEGNLEKIYWWEAIINCQWQDIDKVLEAKNYSQKLTNQKGATKLPTKKMKNHKIINMEQPIGSTINFEVSPPIKKIGLKKYPKEPYVIFEMPVRKNGKHYQVWTGKKWYKLEIKTGQLNCP